MQAVHSSSGSGSGSGSGSSADQDDNWAVRDLVEPARVRRPAAFREGDPSGLDERPRPRPALSDLYDGYDTTWGGRWGRMMGLANASPRYREWQLVGVGSDGDGDDDDGGDPGRTANLDGIDGVDFVLDEDFALNDGPGFGRRRHQEEHPRGTSREAGGNEGCGGGGGGGGVEGSTPPLLERLVTLLTTDPASNDEHSNNDAEDDADADAAKRFASFLFHDRPETRIVWLSPAAYVACDGPASRLRSADRTAWSDPANLFWAEVTAAEGGRVFWLGLRRGGPRHRAEAEDTWPPVLAALASRWAAAAEAAESVRFFLNVGRHVRFLAAVVSPRPLGERGRGRRTLCFAHPLQDVTEAAARILARCTHRDTAVKVRLDEWGRAGAAILAEAIRTDRCPRRLVLTALGDGLGVREEDIVLLATALRGASAVEELDLELPRWCLSDACTRALLGAIRDSAGLRALTASRRSLCDVCRPVNDFFNDFWSAALGSRTLASVDAAGISPRDRSPAAARCGAARHVVELLMSNRVVTDLRYNPDTHDADIMDRQAVPLLQLNRLRAAAANASDRRRLALFFGSGPVRRHPMLRYYLVRSNVGSLFRSR
jgi:hypothetical protein